MKTRQGRFNPKRKMAGVQAATKGHSLAKKASYGGNPEHKRNPGDFGLDPPSSPRPHKSLCDDCGIVNRKVALGLLQRGIELGLISQQHHGVWPQNVWAVTSEGWAVEAQLENAEQGVYHGYPMPESDPFRAAVIEYWNAVSSAHTMDSK